MSSSSLEDVVSPPYRSIIRLVLVSVSVIMGFFIAQDRAASFVDERVRIKTAATDKMIELQMQRLEKMDARMNDVQSALTDIKVDVARTRTILEKK